MEEKTAIVKVIQNPSIVAKLLKNMQDLNLINYQFKNDGTEEGSYAITLMNANKRPEFQMNFRIRLQREALNTWYNINYANLDVISDFELAVINELQREETEKTITGIEKKLRKGYARTLETIRNLENKKIVRTERISGEGNKVYVLLTDKGINLIKVANIIAKAWIDFALKKCEEMR